MLTRREGITGLEGDGRDSSATLGMTWGISRMGYPLVGRGRRGKVPEIGGGW